MADIPAAKQNGYFSLLGSYAGRGGGISISGDSTPSPRCLTGDCASVSVCSRGGQLACVSSGECWPGALPWPAVPRSNECNVYLRDGIIFKKPD